jgi:hypothetical protein
MPLLRTILDRLGFTREGRRAAAARRYLQGRGPDAHTQPMTTAEIAQWAVQVNEAVSISHPDQIPSPQEIIERVARNALPVEEDETPEQVDHPANNSRNLAAEEGPIVRRSFEQVGDGSHANWTSNDYMAAFADARVWHQYDAEVNPRPRPATPPPPAPVPAPAPAPATNNNPPALVDIDPLHYLEQFDGEVYTLAFWFTDPE